jgi:hypothetical protein
MRGIYPPRYALEWPAFALPLLIFASPLPGHARRRFGGLNGAMKLNAHTKYFLRELGFTAIAAFGTAAAVSAVSMAVVVFFAR